MARRGPYGKPATRPWARTKQTASIYLLNLRDLGANLSRDARVSGFAIGSAGVPPDEVVYGLVLCRGDHRGAACAGDLLAAFNDVTDGGNPCRYHKDATIYYGRHIIRFTNNGYLLSSLTNEPEWPGGNMDYVPWANAAGQFMDRVLSLLNRVADMAAAINSTNRYATGKEGIGEQGVKLVYGLVQCTPDLTGEQCRKCLDRLIRLMPPHLVSSSGILVGWRIVGVRCNLRFEKELFFMHTHSTLKLLKPEVVPGKHKRRISKAEMIVAFVVPSLVLVFLGLLLRPNIVQKGRELLLQRDLVMLEKENVSESDSRFSLFRFSKIKDATNNFSEQNKLGEGGFGSVYQGMLSSSNQEIAVKRLSPNSVQGFPEFKNEIKLIASLQHRNLVRLLGCCIKRKECILVYEYMPNGSLDRLIFGSGAKQSWSVRRHIIEGIAEGLLYIHDYAHACIVHRDLKPSNILLDHEMNPKISDFGIARICLSSAMESCTTTAIGTFGYMAPEYFSQSVYSTKSDVFSFGILVLEMISGKRAGGSYRLSGRSYELRRYAWQLWKDQRSDEFVDPSLGEEYQEMDITRCIQIALLCAQDNAEDRPTMHDVTTMLSNANAGLLKPPQPALCNIDIGDDMHES
ncbi:hypothetical protein ACP70R_033735 [Stipagrostis hirtigluma subsp. patula]